MQRQLTPKCTNYRRYRASKEDIRKIIDDKQPDFKNRNCCFSMRFTGLTKCKQDFLLPAVESGRLILIGATTENPSFEVIPALLSRMRVFILNNHSDEDLLKIIEHTGLKINIKAQKWLIAMANGDARQLITVIENTQNLYGEISVENLENAVQSKLLRYDKAGEEHYNVISAFIKSMRASQADAALYYLARMIESGEDPNFIARRMVVFASEDIGVAQPTALVVANSVFDAVIKIGLPECAINLSHGVVHLSNAPKSRASYDGYFSASEDVKKHGNLSIPLHLRNAPTKLMKNIGYGEGYEKYSEESYLPDKIKNKRYFKK